MGYILAPVCGWFLPLNLSTLATKNHLCGEL
jgi:hypothetical protein